MVKVFQKITDALGLPGMTVYVQWRHPFRDLAVAALVLGASAYYLHLRAKKLRNG